MENETYKQYEISLDFDSETPESEIQAFAREHNVQVELQGTLPENENVQVVVVRGLLVDVENAVDAWAGDEEDAQWHLDEFMKEVV